MLVDTSEESLHGKAHRISTQLSPTMPPPLPPLLLKPVPPTNLLTQILHQTTHPTTLIICSTRADFFATILSQSNANQLSTSPIHQIAIARHIRLLFIPTVSHLRAYLGIFDGPTDAKIEPPPTTAPKSVKQPWLIVYNFLDLHRDTSEWSAQGLGATAAGVVDAARRTGFRAVLVDAPYGGEEKEEEMVPILSANAVRSGGEVGEGSWTGRRVPVSRVLGRWFRPAEGEWYDGGET